MTTPADELRAAAGKLRTLPGPAASPTADWLDTTADHVDAQPEYGDEHDRTVCNNYACDTIGHALAVARAINGDAR